MNTGSGTRYPPVAAGGSSPGRISNLEFLRALALALLALALSATALLSAYVAFSPELAAHRAAANGKEVTPRTIQGRDLQMRLGSGEATADKAMAVTRLQQGEDDRAILTRKTSFRASDYPFVEYQISQRHPAESVYLIWRTAENPEEIFNTALQWQGEHSGWAYLGSSAQWSGRITELGLDIYGDLREQPLIISRLTLLPASGNYLLGAIWSQWTAFRAWTQKSAHFLRGYPKHGILSPALAMAAWSGLALLILAGGKLMIRFRALPAYASAVLVPWIALDLLWQGNLSTQLEETKYLFAGKTQHEKHLADWNPDLYKYANHLKGTVLPEPGARIFLLHDSEQRTYTRLKLQYYLLPHNVFNYDRFPDKKASRVGDYILVLGAVDGLEFSPRRKALKWEGKSLRVKLVDSHTSGKLYRVTRRKRK
jgi:hypothetical protein